MKMPIWRVQDRKYHYADDDDDDEMIHIAPLRKSSIIRMLDWKYKKVLQNKHHKEYRSMRKKLRLRRMKRDMAFYYGEQDKKPIPEKRKIINRSKAPHMLAQSFSPVKRFARLIRSFTSDEKMPDSMRWPRKYEQLVNVKKSLDDRENSPGARVYNLRMYDLVLDKKKPDPKGERRLMPSIIQSAYKLMDFFDERKRKKENENDSSNVKFLSPRFFSVMPEKLETPGQLSPSILPLYEDKNEEQILPIPKVMKDVGMSKDDRGEILSFIMEAAGANSAVDEAMKVLEQLDIPGLSGELSRGTKEAMKSFENLGKTLSTGQKRRFDKLGYALMDKDQIDQFHWDTGLFKNKMIKDAFEAYKNAPSRVEQKNFLWNSIRDIADHDMVPTF
ncbi:hypothetical protein WR25_22251 [Diploscapter pachys]|uniref:Uncharacterized protein n=1 Tax=Diploscapter pachys TaxID=2018661 RepID=A0A2A2LGQ9_9BILA|nr:hypothetical protein WR25_22251 [Diploscapter pachys]